MNPLVIKLGGSLITSVPELVQVFRAHAHAPLLIVPGGGPFADLVRTFSPPDEEAHWMAVAAMEQFGWYIASHGLHKTDILQIPSSPHVFLPYRVLREYDPLPHSWEVTSDTIAAWIAHTMGADLLLLKSVDGLYRNGILMEHVGGSFSCREVDPSFLPYVCSNRLRCTILNGGISGRLDSYLRGEPVRSTRVETTF